ncbi:MAG TPA: alpha/beta hydrolase, partial [Beijerinckiaceae bacterium]|nr:alpha/beta hydrolase [Beijerinckiaceae bacterium]
LYLALVAFIYLQQGAMLYPASRERVSAAAAGLPDFQDVEIETEDGERIVAWWKPPEPGRAVLIYFHGNGGGLVNRRFRAPLLVEGGRGLLLASYRGYSGSTGTPSEAGLRRDARAAYAFVASRYEPRRIVLYGESLGTGVAVGLAAEREVAGIVLDAPYSSTADVARHHFWYLPIWLMRDQFRSIDLVHRIQAPLLVLHGDRDGVIPIALGERLFAAAPEPKRSVRLPGVDHVSVLEHAIGEVRAFLAGVEARRP